jgi:hypothetical protein
MEDNNLPHRGKAPKTNQPKKRCQVEETNVTETVNAETTETPAKIVLPFLKRSTNDQLEAMPVKELRTECRSLDLSIPKGMKDAKAIIAEIDKFWADRDAKVAAGTHEVAPAPVEVAKADDKVAGVGASSGPAPSQADAKAAVAIRRTSPFAQTIVLNRKERVACGGGDCQFLNPLSGKTTYNDRPGKWLNLNAGDKVHLISTVETPDCTVVLIETKQAFDKEGKDIRDVQIGTVLRKASWAKLIAAGA